MPLKTDWGSTLFILTTDGFPQYLNDGAYGDLRAYVVIPKLESAYKGWVDIYDQIRTLIVSMEKTYAVDKSKVALTGHSMGGTGTYQLQVKLPDTFACIAPMSGSIRNTETNLTALSMTKIWAFVGTADTIVDPDASRSIIQALQSNDADARLTELDSAGHFDVPSLAYHNDELIRWLVNSGSTPLCGDADGDGAGVDITDATLILRYLSGFPNPYHIGEAAA